MPEPELILAAFAGGIFGAAVGALWAFCLCGLLTLAGCLVVLSSGPDFLLLQVGLGPVFGPQGGGFLAGVVAASYAAGLRGNHPTGSGRDILSPLMGTSWDVLAVGGAGAAAGVLLVPVIGRIPILREFDHLALAIILVIWAGRLLFHRESPFGRRESIKKYGLWGTDNHALSWVGWMSPPPLLIMIGAGMGGLSGAVAGLSRAALEPLAASGAVSAAAAGTVPVIFCWAVSAVMLTALQLGQGPVQKVPVTHAMAVLSAVVFLKTNSLVAAVIGGVLAAFLQEACARLFINHGSDHLDPPAATIAFGVFFLNLLFKPEWLNLAGRF